MSSRAKRVSLLHEGVLRTGLAFILVLSVAFVLSIAGCKGSKQQTAAEPVPDSPLVEASFRPWPEDMMLFVPAFDVESIENVSVSGFQLGTGFDDEGRATGEDYFQSDSLTFTFSVGVQGDDTSHGVSIRVIGPDEAGEYPESELIAVGDGGIAQFTIHSPEDEWPQGQWSIRVLIDGAEVKVFEFGTTDSGDAIGTRLETTQDTMDLSGAHELWRVQGYVPSDITYDVQVLGQEHEPLAASAAHAYFSDDGKTIFTAYPAALDAADGHVLWEGEEYEQGSLALCGNGIYQVDPVRRLWPSPRSFSSAKAALKGQRSHEYEDETIGWSEAENPAVLKARPEDSWRVEGVRSDPTGRYQLFYEQGLVSKPGVREKEPGPWEWMVFDTKAGKVLYVRSSAEVGFDTIGGGSPGETDHDLSRIKVLADGRFIAGHRLVCPDPSQDRDIIASEYASVQSVGMVEGRPSMVIIGLETSSAGPADQSSAPSAILYDADTDKRYPLPEDGSIESVSRDGLTVLCTSESPDGVRELIAWRLDP